MAIEFRNGRAFFCEEVGVEESEELGRWLQRTHPAEIDLSRCTYLHPANVQALLASKATVVAWPVPPTWRMWLESVFRPLDWNR